LSWGVRSNIFFKTKKDACREEEKICYRKEREIKCETIR